MTQPGCYAVLTGEIVKSSRLRPNQLESLRASLIRAVEVVRGGRRGLVKGKPCFFAATPGSCFWPRLSAVRTGMRFGKWCVCLRRHHGQFLPNPKSSTTKEGFQSDGRTFAHLLGDFIFQPGGCSITSVRFGSCLFLFTSRSTGRSRTCCWSVSLANSAHHPPDALGHGHNQTTPPADLLAPFLAGQAVHLAVSPVLS
jgi:hypothetical protein